VVAEVEVAEVEVAEVEVDSAAVRKMPVLERRSNDS
jgi:hypothetical protein